ncbi:MAG: hypothetical protein HY914_01060 [Desulfomonile tiedjei]|nr:hypothetical protein [Desulfomonile tiedjei]
MRSYGTIAVCVILLALGIIYAGGAMEVKGAPIFAHIDKALGTQAFMGTYNKLANVLRKRGSSSSEDDPWTQSHQGIDKLLQKHVE